MPDHLDRLLDQLSSDDPDVYRPAAEELLENGPAAAVPLSRVCNAASRFSHRAAGLLRRIGRPAVEPLVGVLQSGDPDAQLHAIVALSLIADPSSLAPLVEALKNPATKVRQAAISALRSLRDPRGIEPLIDVLRNDEIQPAALAAWVLGWIGDRRAISHLLWALEHRHWRLRQAAASALGDLGDDQTLDTIRAHLFDPKPQVRKSVKFALARFDSRRR